MRGYVCVDMFTEYVYECVYRLLQACACLHVQDYCSPNSYGPYSYVLYSYGVYRNMGHQIVMAYIGIACIVSYIVIMCTGSWATK